MAINRDPVLKRCRSLGIEPAFLGYSKKSKKNPNTNRRKVSEYSLQLKEKQKTKFVYGVLERQFRNYFEMASKRRGVTGEELLKILESRLDNVIFRLGYASTRPQARQFATHGLFQVNGKNVDIPSYLVKPGDVISVKESKKDYKVLKEIAEANKSRVTPKWLEKDIENLSGKVVTLASREDIDIPVDEHLIVELYSK